MVTGFDIIFFWVARMIMMGLEFMNDVPFRDVYIHALIRDEKGQKMSKSSGNVIDPLDMIEKYGADALRMALAALTVQGRDILLSTGKIETYRLFMNKIWNASRFALMNLDGSGELPVLSADLPLALHDRWILTRKAQVAGEVTRLLDDFGTGEAARLLYDFVWGDLCDWYLELSKPALRGDEGEERMKATRAVVADLFRDVLLLLHPFIPFVTEELWELFNFGGGLIEENTWPSGETRFESPEAAEKMSLLQETVRILRNLRAEARVAPQSFVNHATVQTPSGTVLSQVVGENRELMQVLSKIREIRLLDESAQKPSGSLSSQMESGEVSLVVGDILDIEAEIRRLEQEAEAVKKNLETTVKKLANESFINRAPAEVVEKERERLAENEARIARIQENIASLKRS